MWAQIFNYDYVTAAHIEPFFHQRNSSSTSWNFRAANTRMMRSGRKAKPLSRNFMIFLVRLVILLIIISSETFLLYLWLLLLIALSASFFVASFKPDIKTLTAFFVIKNLFLISFFINQIKNSNVKVVFWRLFGGEIYDFVVCLDERRKIIKSFQFCRRCHRAHFFYEKNEKTNFMQFSMKNSLLIFKFLPFFGRFVKTLRILKGSSSMKY